jgi:hypothetical protein|tara:strand:- start:1508 stop:1747 length:240 start_codon:yes stop_codon:yes gene_type:complete
MTKVLLLILTIMMPDGNLYTKVYQAPPEETMEHCQKVVLPGAVAKMKTQPHITQATGVCFEVEIDLGERVDVWTPSTSL